jgi:hypothetical protein
MSSNVKRSTVEQTVPEGRDWEDGWKVQATHLMNGHVATTSFEATQDQAEGITRIVWMEVVYRFSSGRMPQKEVDTGAFQREGISTKQEFLTAVKKQYDSRSEVQVDEELQSTG